MVLALAGAQKCEEVGPFRLLLVGEIHAPHPVGMQLHRCALEPAVLAKSPDALHFLPIVARRIPHLLLHLPPSRKESSLRVVAKCDSGPLEPSGVGHLLAHLCGRHWNENAAIGTAKLGVLDALPCVTYIKTVLPHALTMVDRSLVAGQDLFACHVLLPVGIVFHPLAQALEPVVGIHELGCESLLHCRSIAIVEALEAHTLAI
mmetsp:Transcript_634/g.1472  ORF Transcript_634/g.1472 Transcript_634/m.1472 type:complete len:204 (+) Transcript_634:91-702(+)